MDCDENHLPLRDLLERKDKDIPKMNDMTDETKGDVMTLDQVLETLKARDLIAEANWIRARLATQSAKRVDEDTTRDQRILIRLAWLENSMPIDVKEFAADVRAALEADRAGHWVVDDWRIDHFERARDFAKELGFSGITDALTELSALLKQCKVMVPEGWKLVPVEPTDEMLKSTVGKWTPDTIWKAMLAAAPQPGAEGGV